MVKQIVELTFELYIHLLVNFELLAQSEVKLCQAGAMQSVSNVVAKGARSRRGKGCGIQES